MEVSMQMGVQLMGGPQEFPLIFFVLPFSSTEMSRYQTLFLGKKKLIFISDSSAGF